MFLEEQEHLGWLMFTRAISLCLCWFRRASSRPCIVFCLALWDALDVPPNSEDEPGFSRIRGILWLLPGCAEERPRLLLLDPGARVGQGLFTQPDPGTFQRQTSKRLLKQSGGLSHVVNMGSNRTTTLRCIFTMLGDPSGLSHAEVADSLFLILDVFCGRNGPCSETLTEAKGHRWGWDISDVFLFRSNDRLAQIQEPGRSLIHIPSTGPG